MLVKGNDVLITLSFQASVKSKESYLESLLVRPVLLPLGLDGLMLIPRREWTVASTGSAAQGRGDPYPVHEATSLSTSGRHSGTSTRWASPYQPLKCTRSPSVQQQHDDAHH